MNKNKKLIVIISSIVSSVLAGVIVFLTIFFNIKKKPDEEKKADDDVLKKEIEILKKEHDQLLTQIPKDADWQIYDVDDFYNEEAQKIFQQQKEKIKKEIKDLNVTCNQSDLKAQKQCLLDCNQKVKQTINNFNNFNNTYQQDLIDFNKNLKHEKDNFHSNSQKLKTKQQQFFNNQQDDSFYNISDYQNDYLVQKQEFDHQKEEINTNISTLTNDFSKCQNNKTKLQQYTCYQQLNNNVSHIQNALEQLEKNFTTDSKTAKSKNKQIKQKLDDFDQTFQKFKNNGFLTFIKTVISNIELAFPDQFDTSCQQQETLNNKHYCLLHLLSMVEESINAIEQYHLNDYQDSYQTYLKNKEKLLNDAFNFQQVLDYSANVAKLNQTVVDIFEDFKFNSTDKQEKKDILKSIFTQIDNWFDNITASTKNISQAFQKGSYQEFVSNTSNLYQGSKSQFEITLANYYQALIAYHDQQLKFINKLSQFFHFFYQFKNLTIVDALVEGFDGISNDLSFNDFNQQQVTLINNTNDLLTALKTDGYNFDLLWTILYYSPDKSVSDTPMKNENKLTIFKTLFQHEIIDITCNDLTKLDEEQTTIKTNYTDNLLDYLRNITLFPISLYTFDNNTKEIFSNFKNVKNATEFYLQAHFNNDTVNRISTINFVVNIKDLVTKIKDLNQLQYEEFLNAIDPTSKNQKLPDVKIFQNFTNILTQIVNVDKIIFDYQYQQETITIAANSEIITFDNANNKFGLNNDLIANLKNCQNYCVNYYDYYQTLLLKDFVVKYYQYCQQEKQQVDGKYQKQLNQLKLVPTNIKDNFIYVNDFNNQIKELLEKFIKRQNNNQYQNKINNIDDDYNLYQTIQNLKTVFENQDSSQLQKNIEDILKKKLEYFQNGKINEILTALQSNTNSIYRFFVFNQIENQKKQLDALYNKTKLVSYQLTSNDYETIFESTTNIETFVLNTLKNGKNDFSYENFNYKESGSWFSYSFIGTTIINVCYGIGFISETISAFKKGIVNKKNYLVGSIIVMVVLESYVYNIIPFINKQSYNFSNFPCFCDDGKSTEKESIATICNSCNLIYESNDCIKDVAQLAEKINEQEKLFIDNQSHWVNKIILPVTSALSLAFGYYFLAYKDYISVDHIAFNGEVIKDPWYVKVGKFIFDAAAGA